jgi:hypothetical protein
VEAPWVSFALAHTPKYKVCMLMDMMFISKHLLIRDTIHKGGNIDVTVNTRTN